MQQIAAVIDPFKMQEVRSALEELGIADVMESPVRFHQKGEVLTFRGAAFLGSVVEKVKLEILAADEAVSGIVEALSAIARSGGKDDCRIFVHPYHEVH